MYLQLGPDRDEIAFVGCTMIKALNFTGEPSLSV